jgi:hypothetical protein
MYAQLYTKMVWLTVGCSVCYPLIWLFSEGFGNFSVSFEVCPLSATCFTKRRFARFVIMARKGCVLHPNAHLLMLDDLTYLRDFCLSSPLGSLPPVARSQVTMYSILDILARAVVSFMLFSGHDALGDGEPVSQREFV